MAGKKRSSGSDLNHENWDEEEEPEEVGHFKQASAEEIKLRVIKTPVRRLPPSAKNSSSVFGNLKGLNPKPVDKVNPFSFLGKEEKAPQVKSALPSPFSVLQPQIATSFMVPEEMSANPHAIVSCNLPTSLNRSANQKVLDKSTQLLKEKLIELNKKFISRILKDVQNNPASILSRSFKDYVNEVEKLHNIDNLEDPADVNECKEKEEISNNVPTVIKSNPLTDFNSSNSSADSRNSSYSDGRF